MAEMRLNGRSVVVQDEEAGITPLTVVPAALFDRGHLQVQQKTDGIDLFWQKAAGTAERVVLLTYRVDQIERAAAAARVVTDRISLYKSWSSSGIVKDRAPSSTMIGIGVFTAGVAVILAAFGGGDLLNWNGDRSVAPVIGATRPHAEWQQSGGTVPGTAGDRPSLPLPQPAAAAKPSTALPTAQSMQQTQALAMKRIEAEVERVRQEQYGQGGQGAAAVPAGGGPVRTGEFVTIAE